MKSLLLLLLLSPVCLAARQVVLTATEFPPYTSTAQPEDGVMVALTRAAFAQRGLQLRVEFRPWARALAGAQDGRFAGVLALWYSPERAERLFYSLPLFSTTVGFYARCDRPIDVSSLPMLQRYRIGTVRGYKNPDSFEQAGLRGIDADDDLINLKKLAANRLELALMDREVGRYLQEQQLDKTASRLCWQEPAVEAMPLYIGFSKRHPDGGMLQTEFNLGMTMLRQSGDYLRILRRYGVAP
ncbi:substrate-binding periplasmic protein [Vogesella facilis]|uniref:Substrate-binding periplasmic protein n=1 Tax=Vogesella facilis TaxID=1655232 RepID=A0ABV7RC71_9NEIS